MDFRFAICVVRSKSQSTLPDLHTFTHMQFIFTDWRHFQFQFCKHTRHIIKWKSANITTLTFIHAAKKKKLWPTPKIMYSNDCYVVTYYCYVVIEQDWKENLKEREKGKAQGCRWANGEVEIGELRKDQKQAERKKKTSHWQMYIRIKWIDDGVLNAFSAVASIRNDFRQRSNSNKEKSEMPVSFVALSGFVCVCAKFRDYVYPGNRMDFEINLVLWPFNANTHKERHTINDADWIFKPILCLASNKENRW